MEIFKIEGNIVKPTTEILLLSPFKEIWERDTTPKKALAILEFSFIEFYCSQKKSNPFAGYSNEKRESEIKKNLFSKYPTWQIDELIKKAIIVYNDWLMEASQSMSFLIAAKTGAEKLKEFFNELDMTKMNSKGMPIYKPAEVTRALKDSFEVIKTLDAIEKKVQQEIYESSKIRGGGEINHYEE